MTYRDVLREAEKLLHESEIPDAQNDAWILMEYCFGMTRTDYLMKMSSEPEDNKYKDYKSMIKQRSEHIPLQYITGQQNFMGLDFYVDENVLIPRQDTESVVEQAVKYIGNNKFKVLDMCTGSGCIAITIDKMCTNTEVTAVDLSENALEVAKRNSIDNDADVEFINSDLFTKVEDKYNVIISNPPYIKSSVINTLDEEVKLHEPIMALDGTEDGLEFYRNISQEATKHFIDNEGMLFYEIGCEQADDVSRILRKNGYTQIKVIKDLAGLDRGVSAKYCKSGE